MYSTVFDKNTYNSYSAEKAIIRPQWHQNTMEVDGDWDSEWAGFEKLLDSRNRIATKMKIPICH